MKALLILVLTTLFFIGARPRVIISTGGSSFSSSTLWTSGTGTRSELCDVYFQNQQKNTQVTLDLMPSYSLVTFNELEMGVYPTDLELAIESTHYDKMGIRVTAGDGSRISSITLVTLASFDERILIIDYDFGSAGTFSSTLGTGSTDSELEYIISISPPTPSLFATGASAFVTYRRIKFDQTSTTNQMDYQILEVTSTYVRLKIRKFGDARLQALKGNIVVVASSAASNFGFSGQVVTTDPLPGSGTVIDVPMANVGTKTDYTMYPNVFIALASFKFVPNLSFWIAARPGMNGNNPGLQFTLHVPDSTSTAIGFTVLLFCPDGADCVTSQQARLTAGTFQGQFTGLPIADASLSTTRTYRVNAPYPVFMQTAGISSIFYGPDRFYSKKAYSALLVSFSASSLTIEFTAYPYTAIDDYSLNYMVVCWNGIESYLMDFKAANSNFNTIPGTATRTLSYTFNYGLTNFAEGVDVLIFFTQWELSDHTANNVMEYNVVSATSTSSSISVTIELTITGTCNYERLIGIASFINPYIGNYKITYLTHTSNWVGSSYSYSYAIGNKYLIPPQIFGGIVGMRYQNDISLTGAGHKLTIDNDGVAQYTYAVTVANSAPASTVIKLAAIIFYVQDGGSYSDTTPYLQLSGFPDPTVTREIVIQSDYSGGAQYALIVTDDSTFSGAFIFSANQRQVPRIIRAVFFTQITSTQMAKAILNSFSLSQVGKLTYHLRKLIASSSWNLAGYTSSYFETFPQTAPTDTGIGTFSYGSTLLGARTSYQTVVATRIYSHNQVAAFKCQVEVTFSGIIRALHVNSEFIMADSSIDATLSVTKQSHLSASFQASELFVLTITGSNLVVSSISFVNCKDSSNNAVTPSFTSYEIRTENAQIKQQEYITTSSSCAAGCLSCLDSSTCYECTPPKYLYNGQCVDICQTANIETYPIRARYCADKPTSTAYRVANPSFNSGAQTIQFNYQVEPYKTVQKKTITLIFPYLPPSNNEPILALPFMNFKVAYNSYSDESLPFAMSGTFTSLSSPAKIVTYGVVQSLFAYYKLNSSAPFFKYSEFVSGRSTSDYIPTGHYILILIYECLSAPCVFRVQYTGHMEIKLDDASELVDTSSTVQTHDITFSVGTKLITIFKTGSDYMDFYTLSGTYTFYAPKYLLLEDTLCPSPKIVIDNACVCPPGTTESTPGQCTSTTYSFLSASGCNGLQLTATINTGTNPLYTLSYTWTLSSSDASDTTALVAFLATQTASTINIPAANLEWPATYAFSCSVVIEETGLTYQETLTKINSKMLIDSVCVCPPGTTESTPGECTPTTYSFLAESGCSGIQLTATINTGTNPVYSLSYTWSLSSSTASDTTALVAFLASQTSSTVNIPAADLEWHATYTFACSAVIAEVNGLTYQETLTKINSKMLMDNSCVCPPGTTESTPGQCTSTPYSFLAVSGCNGLQLTATINTGTNPLHTLSYTWSLSSSTASDTTALVAFLATQTSSTVNILAADLEWPATYTFACSAVIAEVNGLTYQETITKINSKVLINSVCVCPPGTTESTPDTCVTASDFDVQGQISVSACDDLNVLAVINATEEAYLGTLNFIWSAFSNSSDYSKMVTLNTFLATQTSKNLTVPSMYLEKNVAYNFAANYTNALKETISDYFTSITNLSSTPKVTIDGGLAQTVKRDKNMTLKAVPLLSNCVGSSDELSVSWAQTGGPALDSSELNIPNLPLWLNIFACRLQQSQTYQFQVTVSPAGFPIYSTTVTVTLTTLADTFFAKVENGDRDHPAGKTLILFGKAIFDISCPDIDSTGIQYTWTCQKSTTISGPYSPCSDPSSIFNVPQSTGDISIPPTYFAQGDFLNFTLDVSQAGHHETTTTLISVKAPSTLVSYIKCLDTAFICKKFSPTSTPLNFEAIIDGEPYSPSINLVYTWTSVPIVPTRTFKNLAKFDKTTATITDTTFKVTLSLANSSNVGKATFEVPINTPPSGGSISASPTTGFSLSTYFNLIATAWVDEDIPLLYEYSYTDTPTDETSWKALTGKQQSSTATTYLSSKAPTQTIYIRGKVLDAYYADTTSIISVQVDVQYVTLAASLASLGSIVQSLTPTDPYENIRLMSLVSNEISNWQAIALKEVKSGAEACPACSNHGSCPDNLKCICEEGWMIDDCSLPKDEYETILSLKSSAIQQINESYSLIHTDDARGFLLNSITPLVNDQVFNSVENLKLIQNVIDDSFETADKDRILSEEDARGLFNILDYMISYSSSNDCNCADKFCQDLEERTNNYFEQISKSSSESKVPGDDPTVINANNFDLITTKTTLCDLDKLILESGVDAPSVGFDIKNKANLDCTKQVTVTYYAFKSRDDLFNCDTKVDPNAKKTIIALQIIDSETGEDLSSQVALKVQMPEGTQCPEKCTNQGTTCVCKDLSVFDVKGQINRIFHASELATVANIGALLSWRFWESPVFWINIGFMIWLGTTVFLAAKFRSFSLLQKLENKRTVSKGQIFSAAWLYSHRLLNIYLFVEEDLSKTIRACLYYGRIILYSTFSALFSKVKENQSVGELMLGVDVYVMLLPYVTVLPINIILETIIKAPSKKSPKTTTKALKAKKIISFIIAFAVISACVLVIFIVAANHQEGAYQKAWSANFILYIIQDVSIVPLVAVVTQFAFLKLATVKFIAGKPGLLKIVNKQINPTVSQITKLDQRSKVVPTTEAVESKQVKNMPIENNETEKFNDNTERQNFSPRKLTAEIIKIEVNANASENIISQDQDVEEILLSNAVERNK